MSRKSRNPNYQQTLESLRAHSFDVADYAQIPGSALVTKHGAGAVLAAAAEKGAPPAIAIAPGAMVGGQLARLVDRGYQKFLQTAHIELPATASQLHAIHQFSEELKQVTGAVDLYNESLGTTIDLYMYDRLQGREAV